MLSLPPYLPQIEADCQEMKGQQWGRGFRDWSKMSRCVGGGACQLSMKGCFDPICVNDVYLGAVFIRLESGAKCSLWGGVGGGVSTVLKTQICFLYLFFGASSGFGCFADVETAVTTTVGRVQRRQPSCPTSEETYCSEDCAPPSPTAAVFS